MREAYPEEYVAFLRLYQHHRYHESTDALEDLWISSRDPFFKALMQLAATHIQLQRGNLYAATRMVAAATHHLQPYAPDHLGLDVARLVADLEAQQKRVAELHKQHGDQAPVPVVLGHIGLHLAADLAARI